jgi:CBS domain-containing protein
MEASIADVLAEKGHQVHVIAPTADVRTAVAQMAQHNVGALVVVEGPRVAGLFGEREVLWRIVHEDRPHDTPVRDVMTHDPILVRPEMRIQDAMLVMTGRRVRHLPVVAHGRLIGLISIGDLTKWVTRDLQLHVGELSRFIHGPYTVLQPTHA